MEIDSNIFLGKMDAKSLTHSSLPSSISVSTTHIPVRTLYFSFVQNFIEHDIKEYFEQFGKVNAIKIKPTSDTYCCFVEFETIEAANKALLSTVHFINGHKVWVEAAKPWYQPDHIFNALDNDCLREIFKYLSQNDLLMASEVCIGFNQLAKDVFSTIFKRVEFLVEFDCRHFEQTMSMFGSSITSVSVKLIKTTRKAFDCQILKTIQKCTTSRLKELRLENMDLFGISDYHATLSNLEKLELVHCNVSNYLDVLSFCTELKSIKITFKDSALRHHNRESIYHGQRLPKLQEIHLIGYVEHSELNEFIKINAPLKKLIIDTDVVSQPIAQWITEHCKDLEELVLYHCASSDIRDVQKSLKSLNQLNSLKKLKVDVGSAPIPMFIKDLAQKLVPIEELTLKNGFINNDAIDHFSQHANHLNFLELNFENRLKDEHLVKLVKNLPNLQELVLGTCAAAQITGIGLKKAVKHANKLSRLVLKSSESLSIDLDDYKTMLKSIQNRPENNHLLVEITSGRNIIEDFKTILEENRSWLYIEQHTINKCTTFV